MNAETLRLLLVDTEHSAARGRRVAAGPALATLILNADTKLRVVSGLLTGIHVPGESHYRLLSAFADARTLSMAVQRATEQGYRMHEFGDSALLLPGVVAAQDAA
jgi:S-adenosylmethionine:tRNA ribosyltransferase-isomerase